MAKIDFHLSDRAKAAAESRAAAGRSTLDAYLESLIIADATTDFGVPEHLNIQSNEQFIALLNEGQASPASEMTSGEWDAMRKRLIDRHAPSKAG